MRPNRRTFLKLSAATAAATGLGIAPGERMLAGAEAAPDQPPATQTVKPMHILILGGTGFTGPFQVRYAVERGHRVTVFNRGKTHPGELPAGVESLVGDRNGQLDALKGRRWDVAIDNPTTLPVWVRDVAQILQGNVDRYLFTSTISVYADHSVPADEATGAIEKYQGADPMKETLQSVADSNRALYGPLKALSEQEAEKWFPGRTVIIRPGLIAGPGDETDRFTYWPVRIARGGTVLAPGAPADPVQFIDARDLAEWTIRLAEDGATGVYNATGPATPLGIGGLLGGIKDALGARAEFVWVDKDFLEKEKVEAWSDAPVWVPPAGNFAGFTQTKIARALAKGLPFRPLAETARDTLAWFQKQSAERQAKMKAGLTPEREAAVLAAWARQAGNAAL